MKINKPGLLILCAGIFLCLITSRFTVREVSSPVAQQVLRLHVLANSDSAEDQSLKLQVKAAIVDALSPVLSDSTGKAAACAWVSDHLNDLETIAAQVIADEGYSYPVTVSCETVWFPNKTYGDMTFPCGYYDSLRVCIGEAEGQNWWCVLYPPLCFIDLTCGIVPEESKEKLQTVLDEDDYNSLLSSDAKPVIRFRIVEWLGELFG